MIHDIAVAGPLQADLLLTQFEIVPYFLDFILANCNLKTSPKLQSFEHLVALICHFTRYSLTPAMREEKDLWVSDDEDQDQVGTFVINGLEKPIKMPPTLIGYNVRQMRHELEKYPLRDQHFEYIMESDLVAMALKEGI